MQRTWGLIASPFTLENGVSSLTGICFARHPDKCRLLLLHSGEKKKITELFLAGENGAENESARIIIRSSTVSSKLMPSNICPVLKPPLPLHFPVHTKKYLGAFLPTTASSVSFTTPGSIESAQFIWSEIIE